MRPSRRANVRGPDQTDKEFDVSTVAIGRRIQERRKANGWSQSELARKMVEAGMTNFYQTTVARTESGEREPRVAEAVLLAGVLKCSVQWLLLADSQSAAAQYADGYRDGLRAAQESIASLIEKGE